MPAQESTRIAPAPRPFARPEAEPLAVRVERHLAAYRGDFRRRDQARWAAVYVQGLLEARGRRNAESLARAVRLPEGLRVEDVAQALQHFLNQSPWDEGKPWRRHQREAARREAGVFVLEEMAFVKQGRHSVGVQRQYSRARGRKLNCQIAVVLHHVGPAGYVPLALQLYLPRAWLRDAERLEAAGVPQGRRRPVSKIELGLELLDEAREAGMRGAAVAAGPGWVIGEETLEGAAARGLSCRAEVPPEWASALETGRRQLLEGLGLGHFEGRSWRGFHHHACLVMLAAGFLASAGSGDQFSDALCQRSRSEGRTTACACSKANR
jgi:SRSO17 transposase